MIRLVDLDEAGYVNQEHISLIKRSHIEGQCQIVLSNGLSIVAGWDASELVAQLGQLSNVITVDLQL